MTLPHNMVTDQKIILNGLQLKTYIKVIFQFDGLSIY